MEHRAEEIDRLIDLLMDEVIKKLDDGDHISIIQIKDGLRLLLISESIPTLKKVVLLDEVNGIVSIAQVKLGGIYKNGKEVLVQ